MKLYIIVAAVLSMFMFSCTSSEEVFNEDTAVIIDYLERNDLLASAQVTSSGIYYIIEAPGNDIKPGLNDNVECNYKGYYPNEEVFDSNNNAKFILGGTIEGWRQGIPLIGEGGTIRLFIPSVLAYGKSGRGDIPGNQELFFDVDLIKVN